MRLSLIVAMDESGVIGHKGRLPWRQPADLLHFKVLTMGKPMLMGRKTFESIGRPLPGRTSIVLTHDRAWQRDGVIAVGSLAEGLERVRDQPELMVIGGAEIYRLTLPQANRIYLTRIHAKVEGDTFFPAVDWSAWRELESQPFESDAKHRYSMTFVTLERLTDVETKPS